MDEDMENEELAIYENIDYIKDISTVMRYIDKLTWTPFQVGDTLTLEECALSGNILRVRLNESRYGENGERSLALYIELNRPHGESYELLRRLVACKFDPAHCDVYTIVRAALREAIKGRFTIKDVRASPLVEGGDSFKIGIVTESEGCVDFMWTGHAYKLSKEQMRFIVEFCKILR